MPPIDPRPLAIVTGSTGWIGSRVCKRLRADYRVVGLDLRPPRDGDDGPQVWIECDLNDADSVERAFEAIDRAPHGEIATAVHLAAYQDSAGEPTLSHEELTVRGTERLIAALRARGARQIVLASSLLVMQSAPEGELIHESSPLAAPSSHQRSILAAERLLEEQHGEIPAVVLRLAGVYDETCRSLPIARQMRRVFERKLETYFAPEHAEHGQPFVHLDDVVAAVAAAIERRAELGPFEVFLIGEPDVVTNREMQELLSEAIHGRARPALRIPGPLAKAGAWIKAIAPGADSLQEALFTDGAGANLSISIDHARLKLRWSPQRRLRTSLPEMARRLVAAPAAWYQANGLRPLERGGKKLRRSAAAR